MFLARQGGQTKQQAPVVVSTGAPDAGRILAVDSTGRMDSSALPIGVGVATFAATAAEDLSAGALVNIFDDAGTLSARKADNSNNRAALGFVLEAFDAADEVAVYPLAEINTALSGLAPGAKYWLGTGGAVIATPVSEDPDDGNTGKLSQLIGVALSATQLKTVDAEAIVL
jgi:hypothetical protein